MVRTALLLALLFPPLRAAAQLAQPNELHDRRFAIVRTGGVGAALTPFRRGVAADHLINYGEGAFPVTGLEANYRLGQRLGLTFGLQALAFEPHRRRNERLWSAFRERYGGSYFVPDPTLDLYRNLNVSISPYLGGFYRATFRRFTLSPRLQVGYTPTVPDWTRLSLKGIGTNEELDVFLQARREETNRYPLTVLAGTAVHYTVNEHFGLALDVRAFGLRMNIPVVESTRDRFTEAVTTETHHYRKFIRGLYVSLGGAAYF